MAGSESTQRTAVRALEFIGAALGREGVPIVVLARIDPGGRSEALAPHCRVPRLRVEGLRGQIVACRFVVAR